MNKVKVTFEYDDAYEAEIVAKMLDVDNKVAPKTLKIETKNRDKKVVTTIEHENSGTIFATVDDLIFTERLISSLIGVGK
jgi:hypothetical protein